MSKTAKRALRTPRRRGRGASARLDRNPMLCPATRQGARALPRGGQPAHLRICEGASMEVTLSDEQPGQIMSRNRYFVLQRSRKAGFWRDIRQMYSQTAIFGKIDLLCTHLGGKTLSKSTFGEYLARKQSFSCAGVQNTQILPSSLFLGIRTRGSQPAGSRRADQPRG